MTIEDYVFLAADDAELRLPQDKVVTVNVCVQLIKEACDKQKEICYSNSAISRHDILNAPYPEWEEDSNE